MKKAIKTPDFRKLNRIFIASIFVFAFLLYGNTIKNDYALDDKLVVNNNPLVEKGINGLPEIFSTQYVTEATKKFGYRPVTQATYAIEYSLFGQNANASHFINILFYILNLIILYHVLKLLLKKFSPYLPFLITLLFAAHPIHTEVVASLKNREEILTYIFALGAVYFFFRFASGKSVLNILWGLIMYGLGYITKMNIISFIVIIPLVQYFFTRADWKRILASFFILLFATLVFRRLINQNFDASFSPYYFENPLYFIHDFASRLSVSFMSLIVYLKLMIIPHPLISYYGFDMVPVTGPGNVLVILSFVIHAGMFIYAVLKIRKRTLVSFAILYYLITISMYSNLLQPIPGIVAERLMYNVSLGFMIALVALIYRITGNNISDENRIVKVKWLVITMLILIIPWSIKTIARNTSWENHLKLYMNDIRYAERSFKMHDLLAQELVMQCQTNKNILNPEKKMRKAIEHYKKTADIYPDYYHTWNYIALIYSDYFHDYDNAAKYFKKTVSVNPDYDVGFMNLGFAYEKQKEYQLAIDNYRKAIELNDTLMQAKYNLSNVLAINGNIEEAIKINLNIIKEDSTLYVPYMNIGNYFLINRDTLNAIKYYEQTIVRNRRLPDLCINLSTYFLSVGDSIRSKYYFDIWQDVKRK
ncbi:MAG: tetratricopeptide repeat protein [Bacteroidota bacterium]